MSTVIRFPAVVFGDLYTQGEAPPTHDPALFSRSIDNYLLIYCQRFQLFMDLRHPFPFVETYIMEQYVFVGTGGGMFHQMVSNQTLRLDTPYCQQWLTAAKEPAVYI